jgi:catechol 2,3-dioxygenase-like lactoylglutathione lyase family enzyme
MLKAAVPVLPVAEIAPATEFWRDRLGFAVGHADDGYAIMERDAVQVHLWAAKDRTWMDRPDRPIVTGAESFLAGTASARIHAPDIDALFEEMLAAKVVHPNGTLGDKPYGLREFAVLDLDGNLVTFFASIQGKEA